MTKAQKFRRRFGDPSQHAEANRRAAEVILQNAKPGEDGLAVTWARGILANGEANGTEHSNLPALPDTAITRR